THAGLGLYDLAGEEAERTQEWRDGVGRLDDPLGPEGEALLEPYRAILAQVRATNGAAYPGSPLVICELLRPHDRGIFVELEPAAAALARAAPGKALRLELIVEAPHDVSRLNGCGLFVLNPPWTLRDEAEVILRALAERLARGGYGAYRCEALEPGASAASD